MRKRFPLIDPDKCFPEKCKIEGCEAVKMCSMKILVQEESDEMPSSLGACKACGKCVIHCTMKAISLV